MHKLRSIDLFSGIGGIALALKPYASPVLYCEIDPYARSVLQARMESNDLPRAPIHDDVRTLHGFPEQADLITAGFPCQDISTAGPGGGLAGQRSGLFFEVMRLAKEIKPSFVFLENVPAIRTRGLARILEELASAGFDARYGFLSARDVGAPHIRERWFLLAHAHSPDLRQQQGRGKQERETQVLSPHDGSAGPVAYSHAERLEVGEGELTDNGQEFEASFRSDWWASEPSVGRVADGIPSRVDRIKALGNAVVPLQCRLAFERLIGLRSPDSFGQ
jgi:DNA (cytosine-5)-methyltransferase 1